MLGKNAIIEIGDNYVCKYDFYMKNLKLDYKRKNYDLDVVKKFCVDLKTKKVCIILEGEELQIKLLKLPRTKKEILDDIIKNELHYHFNNLDGVIFNYTILKEYENNIEVIVFCINEKKVSFIQNCLHIRTRINAVYLLQFCILNHYKIKITEKNYIFVFKYKDNLYLLYCIDNKILHNTLYKSMFYKDKFTSILNSFIERCKILYDVNINKIYSANISENIELWDMIEKISYEDLGPIDEEQFVYSITVKRSWGRWKT
jgi:hypothetical protein